MFWWSWSRLSKPAWIPKLIAGLTLAYILTDAVARDSFALVTPQISAVFFPHPSLFA